MSCACLHKLGLTVGGASPLRKSNLLKSKTGGPFARSIVSGSSVAIKPLLAFSKHQKQIRLARSKIDAVQIADDLLNRMSASRTGIPPAATGPIPEHPNWSWQTSVTAETLGVPIPMQIIKLQIMEQESNSKLNLLVSTIVVKAIEP